MRKMFVPIFGLAILIACTGTAPTPLPAIPTATAAPSTPEAGSATPAVIPAAESPTAPASETDFFTQASITLPAPVCNGLTQSQMEGPYYRPDTPERNSLLEEDLQGTRLILVG